MLSKSKNLVILNITLFAACGLLGVSDGIGLLPSSKKLVYTFPKTEFTTSDASLLKAYVRVEQKSKDYHGIYGEIYISKYADQNLQLTFSVLRSKDPSNFKNMQPTLFRLPSVNSYSLMDVIYKNYLMKDVAECSNLPQFKGSWGQRSLAGNYTLNNCALNSSAISSFFVEGNYWMIGSGKRTKKPTLDAKIVMYMSAKPA